MTPRHSFLIRFVLVGAAGALCLPGLSDPPARAILPSTHALPPTQAKKASLIREIGRLPLAFESNQGQSDARVRFLSHTGDSTLFLTPSEAVFTLSAQPVQSSSQSAQRKDRKAGRTAEKVARVALRMQMVGANPKATALIQQPLAGRANYFIGNDSRKWHTGVPTFGKVGFHEVYKGVDLVYYGNQQHLEYDFVVAPHADPKQIQLHFAGAQGVHINAVGDLVVHIEGRELRWQKPTVYQLDKAGKHSVAAHFRLKQLPNGQKGVGFALGNYDSARPLVIDPVLLYSTYLGGVTQTAGYCVAVDSSGDAYVGGISNLPDFPTTAGAYQETSASPVAAFVTKFSPSGAVIYSTLLEGNSASGSSLIWDIALDNAGNAYVTGGTFSTDFPTTPGAFQGTNRSFPGDCAFVTKLNPTGTALVYSTYLGGTDWDEGRGIAIDSVGNAYVAGTAYSNDFPTTPGAFQPTKATRIQTNGFVTKLNPTGTALIYSTYLGGTGDALQTGPTRDNAYGIAVDSSGNAYVTGSAYSSDFPVTPGAFQTVNHHTASASATNGFVTKLNPTGTALVYSTFLGGSNSDSPYAIALDGDGNTYITGTVTSTDFPTTPGAFATALPPKGGGFVAKLNPAGTGLVYSTLLGGSGGSTYGVIPSRLKIDSARNVYITGSTDTTFPTTIGAFQRTRPASSPATAFVMKLNMTGTALLYSTLLGGATGPASGSGDAGIGIAVDSAGNAYVTGSTYSTDFPVTPGAFQTSNHATQGRYNAFVTGMSTIPIFPDFNNDNFTDLLLQNPTTGAIGCWFMQGDTRVGGASFSLDPPAEFALVGVGDFSANGASTLVLQNQTDYQIALWYTSGTNHTVIPGGNFVDVVPVSGWKVTGVGDFNKDGRSDLVFQNQTTGRIAIWFMDGSIDTGGVLLPNSPAAGWSLVGVGDVDADGSPDLIFQNQTSGQLVVWYFNGTTYVGGNLLTAAPAAGWHVASVGDFNGDGFADLIFTNATSNQAVVWSLQNGNFIGGSALSASLPSGWTIVGPR